MSTEPAGLLIALAGATLLLADQRTSRHAARLSLALVRRGGTARAAGRGAALPSRIDAKLTRTRARLALAGEGTSLGRFLAEKLLAAVALPAIPLLPFAALTARAPSLIVTLPLALLGFFIPDLALRRALNRRRERVLLELPEALSMLSLALSAGRSLHQALALAARETPGPLGADLGAALSLARREPSLDERSALVRVAHAGGEPNFMRFAELLAAKESPYRDFLRGQTTQARAEQSLVLERAADRAQLAMHAPLAPLITTLVLLVSYGFLHLLDQSI